MIRNVNIITIYAYYYVNTRQTHDNIIIYPQNIVGTLLVVKG